MFDSPIITHDLSIERVLNAGIPVVLVFLNGPASSELKQAMDRAAKDYAGKLLVAQIQAKDSPQTLKRYQVSTLPALVTVINGKEMSHEESLSGSDLINHARYAAAEGPKPEKRSSTGSRTTASTPGNGYAQKKEGTLPLVVTDTTFEREVMGSNLAVLVDFWAPWCGPCKMTDPIVTKLAGEMAGKLKVAKVNVDENPQISQRYGIMSIPTMMVVKNGKIVDRWVGAQTEAAIRSRIQSAVR